MTGTTRHTLMAASAFGILAGLIATPAAAQQVIVVPAGTTDTTPKTVGGTDSVTVEAGGTLQTTTNPAINWATASTDLRITNSGTIRTTATGGRAIGTSGNATQRTITLTNNAGGLIESADDAIRINNNVLAGSVITINNFGTIRTTVGGQAIDFDAISTLGATITINNFAGGMILSTGQDAIRPGQGAVVNNAGTIRSDGAANNSYDGIDWQQRAGTVNNAATGIISGLRHGITSDTNVTVTNFGSITGRNGSGIGSDGVGTVTNHGTITGTWDGVAINGDGDGVDIDGIGTVRNFGIIRGLTANGVDSGGRPNSAQGVAMGGGLIENNAGALILGGAQGILINRDTNPGGVADGAVTIINAGTIRGTNGAAISIVGDFNDTITNSGEITGGGSVAIDLGGGNDTLNLLNGSVITGTVDGGAGTDRVTLGGTSGIFAGAVNFERLDVLAGRWTLSAASNFTAGTGIASGATLTGNATTLTGAIEVGGTLVVDQAAAGTLAATLSGTGLLVKAGAGTLGINAQPGFTGTARIDAGRLNVLGALPAAVTVATGGTLGGTGSVGATTVQSGGTISPGLSIGTLTVNGNFTQATGSTYFAETAANGTSDRIAVNGAATIQNGATLALTRDGGAYVIGTQYTLLTATGGITGTYSNVTQTVSGGVELRQRVLGTSLIVQAARTGAALITVGATPNQTATATALAPLGIANAAYAALTLIPDDAATRAGLDSLSGEIHPTTRTAIVRDAVLAQTSALSRFEDERAEGVVIWGQFVAGEGDDEGRSGVARADRDTLGGFGGVETGVGGEGLVGLGGGYTRTRIDLDARASTARVKTIHAFGYAGGSFGPVRLRAVAGYGWGDVDTQRSVAFTGFSDTLRAAYDTETLYGAAEIGYAFEVRKGVVEPFAGLSAVRTRTDAFVETGGAAALSGARRSETALISSLGLKGEFGVGEAVSLRTSAAWQHGFEDIRSRSSVRFAGGAAFGIEGTSVSRNAAAPSFELIWKPSEKVRVAAGYAGVIGDSSEEHSGRVSLSFGF